jgi:hypothetical protein
LFCVDAADNGLISFLTNTVATKAHHKWLYKDV